MKMDYLLNDSRSKEALEVGLKREKLLKDIAKLPEKTKGFLDLQYTYLYAKMSYICYLEGKYDQAGKILSTIFVNREFTDTGWKNLCDTLSASV